MDTKKLNCQSSSFLRYAKQQYNAKIYSRVLASMRDGGLASGVECLVSYVKDDCKAQYRQELFEKFSAYPGMENTVLENIYQMDRDDAEELVQRCAHALAVQNFDTICSYELCPQSRFTAFHDGESPTCPANLLPYKALFARWYKAFWSQYYYKLCRDSWATIHQPCPNCSKKVSF